MMKQRSFLVSTLLFLLQDPVSGIFYIRDVEPGLVVVRPGDEVSLRCETNNHYEWCTFISPQKKTCDFEWKYAEDNITMQACDDLKERVSFYGKYDDKHCGITFRAQDEDSGLWRCEIEEYLVGRDRGDGRKDTGTMQVKIDNSTTTTTTTSTTTSATASSTPPSTTTSSTTGESSSTTSKQDAVPDAVPRTDDIDSDSASSNTSTVVAIIVIIIIVSCVGGSAYYYRRRQKKRPDAAAAVVYDREFRQSHDTANMMRSNSQTGVNTGSSADLSIRDLHRDDPDNRQHLHEFFPHSDSFA